MTRVQRWFGSVDAGYLVVLAIAVVAVWPFIGRASLPQETDAELHIFRLQELSYLVRGGELYPRWAPNFYHGYGYPIFNYYAPLTYYLGLVVELMPRLGPVAGVKAVFVLGLFATGLGMYGFVRDNWGRPAGYVAAAVYIYAPYVHFIDPHARGVLAESFSLGVFPLALWALNRLRQSPTPWSWLASVMAIAAVILSHNLMALLFFGILMAWSLWQIASGRKRVGKLASWCVSTHTHFWLLPTALFLGLGVSAFFWLPVILERNAVTLTSVIGQGSNYDFHNHFLSLHELFAFSRRLDWGASEPNFRFNLGVAQWLLGGVGVTAIVLRRARESTHAVYFALSLGILLLLMLPVSTFLWELIPFLPFFQFPWRLLGAAGAMLAVLAGVGAEALVRESRAVEEQEDKGEVKFFQRSAWITATLVTLPIILGLPLSQPAPWPDFGPVNMLRMTEIEWKGRWLGTTSTADYVPATVDVIPERKGSVVRGFYEGRPLDRVNRVTLPEGAVVEVETVRPLMTRYHVDLPKDTLLRLFQFDFPGWVARIDGQIVETDLARPEGFIVIPVPAGKHIVEVEFGTTPARILAAIISWLALATTLLLAWRMSGYRSHAISDKLQVTSGRLQATDHEPTRQSWPVLQSANLPTRRLSTSDRIVLAAVLAITAVYLIVLQPLGWLHLDSNGNIAEPAEVDVWANYGGQVALIGYSAAKTRAKPGDTIDLVLYWKAQQQLEINYQVFVHVLGPDGSLVTQSHKLNPGEFPTKRWPPDRYIWDEHQLVLPLDMPAAEYRLATGLWVQDEGWRLPLLDENGKQIGDNFVLFELRVEE